MGGSGEWKEIVQLCHQGSVAPALSSGSVGAVWWEGDLVDVSCSCVGKENNVFFSLDVGEVLVKITENEIPAFNKTPW